MSRILVCAFALVLSAVAVGQAARTATLTLKPPAKYEDGSALDCNAVACAYSVYRGTCGAALSRVVTNSATPVIPVTGSVPGQCFRATATAEGAESLQSVEVRFKGKLEAPTITVLVSVEVQ
jgi:hypothetical protein